MRTFLLALLLSQNFGRSKASPQKTAAIPDYVTKYAPLVYLDQNELYLPSDLQAQLNNTFPTLNYTNLTNTPSPLLLSDLDLLNTPGNCTDFNCPVYLTSKDNVTANPPWLYGVLPDATTFETIGAKSCAVIVNDHGNGLVDAFYMYFYAFNLGETVFGQVQGDHVGDWEHSMVRFQNGTPISVWLSQHDYGQAFTYDSLSKNGSRPIIYSAIGSHANFAVQGTHSRVIIVTVNDYTSAGPIWDPVASAFFYTYESTSSSNSTSPLDITFIPSDTSTPTSWLSFLGRWGDEQYPDSDPRQVNFDGLNLTWKYESGPTGPLDKDLDRVDVCPAASGTPCVTLSQLPATSGSSIAVTVTRTSAAKTMTSMSSRPITPTSASAGDNGKSVAGKHACSPIGFLSSLAVVVVTTFWI